MDFTTHGSLILSYHAVWDFNGVHSVCKEVDALITGFCHLGKEEKKKKELGFVGS